MQIAVPSFDDDMPFLSVVLNTVSRVHVCKPQFKLAGFDFELLNRESPNIGGSQLGDNIHSQVVDGLDIGEDSLDLLSSFWVH